MVKAWVKVDGSGRIEQLVERGEWAASDVWLPCEFPDGFDVMDVHNWSIAGGEPVRDGHGDIAEAERIADRRAEEAKAEQMRAASVLFVRTAAADMSDDQAGRFGALFEEWAVGGTYETGGILRHGGALYRVLQDVPSAQAEHAPDKATSLYRRIGEPSGGVFPWVQPLGATDAYGKGDKVAHKGKTWVSTVDSNVWEPGVYGWDEVSS